MRSILLFVTLAWSGVVWADADTVSPLPIILAGEILLSPPKSDPPSANEKEASRHRDAARDYRKDQTSSLPTVVVPDEEDGMLSPRRGTSSAADNAARARANRQNESVSGTVTPLILSPETSTPASRVEGSTQRARDNRNRANEYRTGIDNRAVVVGKDGLPVIDCSSTENAAGRIGDDTRSGSVIILIQDRNQIKVRCR